MQKTSYFFTPKRGLSQLIIISSALLGLLAAATTNVFSAPVPLAVAEGLGIGSLFFALSVRRGYRQYSARIAALQPECPSLT
ncbi:hypothetical protein [Mycetocola sp.]|uniref:hypothetical protein n=1 Tax=Mycetocola sp. TaxID=1871042 RepID=UPI0026365193|nr:hypothetical protein [Mycetocola sp.]